ncbi:putative inhibitor of apoptosis [Saccostrea cucullata]|uniref:putative inhibitor of apoptosis n=1 Tax=Saccostrea cuccullata TaxID=36930 RepID=UPI002ED20788
MPSFDQRSSKAKLKKDNDLKETEEQAKAKARTNQGAGGLDVKEMLRIKEKIVPSIQHDPSAKSSLSTEPTSTLEVTVEEIQTIVKHFTVKLCKEARASSKNIDPSVPLTFRLSRQITQTSSAQSTTNTGRSSASSATRQVGVNPPEPSRGGADPLAPNSAERLAQLNSLGFNFEKPKYPVYAEYSTRISSFDDGWPSHMAQTPREMGLCSVFFFCGGGLRNWDRTDEPWMEHAKWFPRCAFLRNNKGDKYVSIVHRRHQEQEASLQPSSQLRLPVGMSHFSICSATPCFKTTSCLSLKSERDVETIVAEALKEMRYTNQIIQRAMNYWRRNLKPGRRHPPPMTASAILDIIEILESGSQENAERQGETPLTIPEKQVLQEDFLGLTETIVCKVCCDKDVAAAFLPCGHLICCLDCAPAMRRCPLCAELIKGTVKTYFANDSW